MKDCEERAEDSSVCCARVVARSLVAAGPNPRCTTSFNQALEGNASVTQFQWKLGFAWIWAFPLLAFCPADGTVWKFQS